MKAEEGKVRWLSNMQGCDRLTEKAVSCLLCFVWSLFLCFVILCVLCVTSHWAVTLCCTQEKTAIVGEVGERGGEEVSS